MHLNNYCPGCGGGEGNQGCRIAKCSLQYENIEYCNQCQNFPCEHYEGKDEFDSFITYQNRRKDFDKIKKVGAVAYQAEQKEKIEILNYLLKHYNDGRKKTFFCLTVNLLELSDLKNVLNQIEAKTDMAEWSIKEKSALVVKLFQDVAEERKIILKLRKKANKSKDKKV